MVGTVASGHVSVAWAQVQVTVLHRFDPTAEGYGARYELIQGPDGTLYGTTGKIDTPSASIFRLRPDSSSFAVLHTFTGPELPNSPPLPDSDGMLYGTTSGFDGQIPVGAIFRFAPDGSGFTEVYRFSGSRPQEGGLVEGPDGTLYGTTASTEYDPGSVFSVQPDGSNFTILHNFSFTEPDGFWPNGPLLIGSDGRLYGTTHYDVSDGGTVFAIATDGSGFTVLHTFRAQVDGHYPLAGVIQGLDGMLYGTTYWGGTDPNSTFGTVFKVAPDGSGFATLHNFEGPPNDGAYPWFRRLLQGTNAILYGEAGGGRTNQGTLFQLAPDGSGFAVLLDFPLTAGNYPDPEVIQGADGTLFGMTGTEVFALTLPPSTERAMVATAGRSAIR